MITLALERVEHGPAIERLLDCAFGEDRWQKTCQRLRDGQTPIAPLCLVALACNGDGDDPEQLAWALGRKEPAKLILVKGAPLELMRARQRRFYFDQGGKLVAHFAIRAVPALVSQRGRQLEVSEIALPSKKGTRR